MDKHAKLMDYDWMYTEYVVNQRTAVDIANELSVYYSTVIEYCKYHDFKIRQRSNYSITETEIRSFLDELGIEYISNDRELLGNKELDILIPSKKLAIEVNGLYWHSFAPNGEKLEDRQRHLRKTEELSKYGITLLHVTDWEWHNKRDIIKSIIKSKLGICDRVFARKCSIYVPTANEVREFLNDNHLQGYIPAKFHVGLKHGDELVEVVSIGVNRYKSDKSMELLRLASKRNITVVGGAGKLLKHARGLISNAKIVSYCDRSKSNGSGYESMGFILHSITGPGYFWTNGTEIISRYKTQKKNLHKLLPGYDQKLSEAENMFNHGYRRYWDCGNFVFELQ